MAWLNGWNKRIELSINDYAGDIGASVTWFPVTVFLDNTQAEEVFTELTTDAEYLKTAVTKADGITEMYVEFELFDVSETKGIFHTSIDGWTINANTSIFLYYDSTHTDNNTYIGAIGARTEVWDGNFKVVYHMADLTTSTIEDSTSNNNDGTKKGANEPNEVEGKVGQGQDFDGTNDYINLPASDGLYAQDAITVEAILDCDGLTTGFPGYYGTIYSTRDSGNTKGFSTWFSNNGGTKQIRLQNRDSEGGVVDTANDVWVDNTDYYIAITHVANTSQEIWINGASSVSDTQNWDFQKGVNAPRIGQEVGSNTYEWNGIISEFRISNVKRADSWIKGTDNSLFDTLFTYGSEETEPEEAVGNAIFFGTNF